MEAIDKQRPRHTPFDGSHPPFHIGLQPLDLQHWIEVDDNLDVHLAEKERVAKLHPGKTFMAEPGTEAAQGEVLDLICCHLETRFADTHQRDGNDMQAGCRRIALNAHCPKLLTAARLVQEDLLIMRRDDCGWRLVAGSLSFPSSWSLREKFGRRMEDIHAPVPGFGQGTRNATVINRIFDRLHVEHPVWRMNWSVYSDDELFHENRAAELVGRRDLDTSAFLRVEYQTLRKLPASGDILFTVRIHVDPLSLLSRHSDRRRICTGFAASLEALDTDQLDYKGLSQGRDILLEKLRKISGMTALNGTNS